MALNRPSLDVIYNRLIIGIKSRLTGNAALPTRAVLRVLAKVFAGAIHLLYGYIEYISKQLFVYSADDEWLDRLGYMWNVLRKPATFATGVIVVKGEEGKLIPANTKFQSENGNEYVAVADYVIESGISEVTVKAVEAGEESNCSSGKLNILSPISGIESEANILYPGIIGGVNQEDNDIYRDRILSRIQNPPMGGNKRDYESWATSEEIKSTYGAVKKAWCFPLASGAGTVDIVIMAVGNNPQAPAGLIADVQAYIDYVKPVAAKASVKTIDKKNIDFIIGLSNMNEDIKKTIQFNLFNLLADNSKPGTPVLISHIRDAIMSSGVDDYKIIKMFKSGVEINVDDIALVNYEYPWLGTILFESL